MSALAAMYVVLVAQEVVLWMLWFRMRRLERQIRATWLSLPPRIHPIPTRRTAQR